MLIKFVNNIPKHIDIRGEAPLVIDIRDKIDIEIYIFKFCGTKRSMRDIPS